MELTPEKLIGETIGLLFVNNIDHIKQDSNGHLRTYMNCTCSCGEKRIVDSLQLKLGTALHCRKSKNHKNESIKLDLVGKKFGKLTVIQFDKVVITNYKSKKQTDKLWICKCECGTEKTVKQNALVCNRILSCGCRLKEIHKNIGIKRKSLPKGEAAWNVYYSKYKYNAEKRDRIFDITFESFKKFCTSNCKYCGIVPSKVEPSGRKTWTVNGTILVNGIDRVNNNIGYIESNCVPCCSQCNAAKKDFTEKQWNEWLDRIFLFRNK